MAPDRKPHPLACGWLDKAGRWHPGRDETLTAEEERLYRWRADKLAELGLEPVLADELARADVSHHDVDRLLKAGSTLDAAYRLLRP